MRALCRHGGFHGPKSLERTLTLIWMPIFLMSAFSSDFCRDAAKDFFGEAAGAGWTGRAHFEPDPGADVGITNR